MQILNLNEVQQVAGGNAVVEAIAAYAIVHGVMAAMEYFGQDNGGPSAADWAASTGYVG